MHYYTFHPKDYISKTHFLEPMEDLAYRRMLDYIYLNECHLPDDISDIAKKINMRTHTDSIANVLREFFELSDDGYMNDRAEQEIAKYQEKSDKARKSANARWKKKPAKVDATKDKCERIANAKQKQYEGNANQEPLTTNHEPLTNINIPFDEFWDLYDYKKGKKSKVETKWKSLKDSDRIAIIENIPSYKLSTPDKRFRKQPLVYLNNEAWLDEIVQYQSQPSINQVNNYEGQSDYNNFTQSVQQQLMQQFEREDAQETNNDFSCRDVYPMEDQVWQQDES